MKLTDLSVQRLKATDKQVVYYDDSLPNFGIRVGKRAKTFIVRLGPTRTIKSVGRYPDKSLKQARQDAKKLLLAGSPLSGATPYSDAVETFLEEAEGRNRPETVRQYKRHLEAFAPNKRLGEVTRADVKAYLNGYSDRPAAYAHAVASLRVFFNWCVRQELLDRHPLAGERLKPVKARARVLTLDELRKVYAYDFPPFSDILKFCILTGQRRGEVAQIQPDWIGEDTLTFPSEATKNGREHTIPLTDTTKALAERMPGTWNGWANGKRRIDKYVEIDPWTIHDLRRTFSTIAAELGTPIHITERILNHVTGSMTPVAQIYNRYQYLPEMRQALEKMERYVIPS